MVDLVSISDSALSAKISAAGAELQRLQDRDGSDLLWSGDPAVWAGRAPLLFPLVGETKDKKIKVDGQTYEIARHGFTRTSRFALVTAEKAHCIWRLEASEATRRQYPFEFCLDLVYRIERGALHMTAEVTNRGDRPMPASFGFHPALRWPLPSGASREAHEILFEYDEPAPVRRLANNLLSPVLHPTPVQGRRLALRDELFRDDALIFDTLESRGLVYGAPGHRSLRVTFPGMPHLGIWTKPGAGYVCIEPWQGYASPDSFDGELGDKPGMVSIGPGATKRFEMSIAPEG